MEYQLLKKKIKSVTPAAFDSLALEVFRYQYTYNPLYGDFCRLLRLTPDKITTAVEIPFLPISFFKSHVVKTGDWEFDTVYKSSGTTSETRSQHFIKDKEFYLKNAQNIFSQYYESPEEYCFLALLPGYIERPDSSLISMMDFFIQRSKYSQSGFYIEKGDELFSTLLKCIENKVPTILFGVSFALIDFAKQYSNADGNWIIMNTGGMKSTAKEITAEEWLKIISNSFPNATIHGEYGMTELLSQAYSSRLPIYKPGRTLKAFTREITDPLTFLDPGLNGGLNFVDLANIDSCSFIATDDLGVVYPDGTFELRGRMDNSDLRGCNLLFESKG